MLGTIIPAGKCDTCPETHEVYLRLVTIPNDEPGPPNKGSVDMAFCNKCRTLWDKRDQEFCAKAKAVIDAKFARKLKQAKREVPRYISMDFPLFATLYGVPSETIEEIQAVLYDEWLKGKTATDDSNGLTMHFMLYRVIKKPSDQVLPELPYSDLRQRQIEAFRKALQEK